MKAHVQSVMQRVPTNIFHLFLPHQHVIVSSRHGYRATSKTPGLSYRGQKRRLHRTLAADGYGRWFWFQDKLGTPSMSITVSPNPNPCPHRWGHLAGAVSAENLGLVTVPLSRASRDDVPTVAGLYNVHPCGDTSRACRFLNSKVRSRPYRRRTVESTEQLVMYGDGTATRTHPALAPYHTLDGRLPSF